MYYFFLFMNYQYHQYLVSSLFPFLSTFICILFPLITPFTYFLSLFLLFSPFTPKTLCSFFYFSIIVYSCTLFPWALPLRRYQDRRGGGGGGKVFHHFLPYSHQLQGRLRHWTFFTVIYCIRREIYIYI